MASKNKSPYDDFTYSLHTKWLTSDHKWANNDDGFIDMLATAYGFHNGPRCTVCGFTGCWHCLEVPPPCKGKRK